MGVQHVGRLDHAALQLVESDVPHGVVRTGAGQIAQRHATGVLAGGMGQQIRHAGVADALGGRHLLEFNDVGVRANFHRPVPG